MINSDNLIQELNREFKKKYPDYKGTYFHGSRLKDISNDDSDFDFVFVFERNIDWRFENEIWDIIYEYDLKYNIVIDARIYSLNEFHNTETPFRKLVIAEGRYYAA